MVDELSVVLFDYFAAVLNFVCFVPELATLDSVPFVKFAMLHVQCGATSER